MIDTSDCDMPSCVTTSGATVMVIDVLSSDGPPRGGVSCFFEVQAPSTSAARRSDDVRRVCGWFIDLSNGPRLLAPVREIDADVAGDADAPAGLVVPVEGDAGDGADDARAAAEPQGAKRRLALRLVADQREAGAAGAADRHRHRAVERMRHVDAWRVAAVGADVLDVILRDGDG